jgi:hypothetical protein
MQWNNPKSTEQQIEIIFGELLVEHRTVEDIISNKEFPANDIVRVNKFDDVQNLYLRMIISVCHACIIKYCFYKLK